MKTPKPGTAMLTLVALGVLTSACLDRKLAPLNPCLVSTVSRAVAVSSIDKVDLLFMVDNSGSMQPKQNSLKAQFPHMIQVLSTGMRNATDQSPFPPVKDMHLAVVSSDMGVVGQQGVMGCDPNGGDDGRLKHVSSGDAGCKATYPSFLTYNGTTDNPQQIGVDFGCIASLGAMGCNYEHQLESPFKALWPTTYSDAMGNVVNPNPYMFLAPPGGQTLGRGDVQPPDGAAGFVRKDPTDPSVLGIILLTDEDDQSSANTAYLSPSDPSAMQSIQVRPAQNAQNLYPLDRYENGFKMLRPGLENLLVFAAITGVPTDLVDAKALANVDLTDDTQRNAYYDRVANDRRMQPTITGGFGGQMFQPACTRTNAMRQQETATPARRILDVVRSFGANGTFQSICADDYGPGMDAIIEIIARQLGAVCLPRPLVRRSDGTVPCNVVWELPKVDAAPVGTPTDCSMAPFLHAVGPDHVAMNERGGTNCTVDQLPITGANVVPNAAGWYYDTFSPGVMSGCPKDRQQRVAFTDAAKPSNGVTVKLECLNEVQSLPNTRKDVSTSSAQPTIGSACANVMVNGKNVTGDAACVVGLTDGTKDSTMFCHPQLNVCVQGCTDSNDCPPAWVCDDRDETVANSKGRAYCANPTCGVE
jgi:hypothetical protein